MREEVKSGRPRWSAGLVCALVVLALGCARHAWKREDVRTWEGCCDGVDACLALLQEVRGPDAEERWLPPEQQCASWKLGRVGEDVVPRLIPLLQHPERRVRAGAAHALADMGEKARGALPALLEAYEREPGGMALDALSSLDDERAAPAIVRHLLDSPTSALEHLGPTLAPVLVEVLENPESSWEALVRARYVLARRASSLLTDGFVPRLQALLARELDEPTLRRPPGTSCPSAPAPSCEAVFDGCTPRAAYVASVLAAYESRGAKAAPEALQALQRADVRLTPVALQALVAFESPAAVPEVLQQLAVPECRARALKSLASLGPVARPGATEPLLRLLATGEEGWERARAAEALGSVGDAAALEALRQAVYAPHSEVQAAAVDALGSYAYREHAEELVPLLQQVATTHTSPVARGHARLALHGFPGEEVRPGESADCARVIPGRGGGWTLCEGHTSLQLHWEKPKAPPRESPCAGVPGGDSASLLEAMGEACLVGRDDGEFGGTLEVHEAGRVTVLEESQANPLQAVRMHGTLVVVEGLAHMYGGAGRLVRVDASEGRWRATPWVTLPGAPMAYALDEAGDLVVGTTDQRLDELVCGRAGAFAPAHVVRVTRDGRASPVEPDARP